MYDFTQICKYFLIAFNILFANGGICLVALGMWLRFGVETRGFFNINLNTTQFNNGVIVLVVTGVLMQLVAAIGHFGARNNSKSALGVLSVLLTVLIIMEITAGVMAFKWSDRVSDELMKFYDTIYDQYTRSPGQAVTLNLFHNVVSDELMKFYDTIYNQYPNTRSPGQAATLNLFHNVFGCCGKDGTFELFELYTCPQGSFLQSCPGVIKDVFTSHAPLVLGGFLGMAGIMLLALGCSFVIYYSLRTS